MRYFKFSFFKPSLWNLEHNLKVEHILISNCQSQLDSHIWLVVINLDNKSINFLWKLIFQNEKMQWNAYYLCFCQYPKSHLFRPYKKIPHPILFCFWKCNYRILLQYNFWTLFILHLISSKMNCFHIKCWICIFVKSMLYFLLYITE